MEDFLLEREMDKAQSKFYNKKRKNNQNQVNNSLQIQIFKLQNQLHEIIEDFYEQASQNQYYSQFQSSFQENDCKINTNTFMTNYYMTLTTDKILSEDQNHQTVDLPIIDYSSIIQTFSNNPKNQIMRKLQEIQNTPLLDDLEKKEMFKKYIAKYLIDYQVFSFQENWKELPDKFREVAAIIKKKTEKLFSKSIGGISFSARRVKLLKYFQKKKGRIWRKKVSYDCRKKVADGRLRIKGKFVTRDQACVQLGVQNLDMYTGQQIKSLLQKRLQNVQEFDEYFYQQLQ